MECGTITLYCVDSSMPLEIKQLTDGTCLLP